MKVLVASAALAAMALASGAGAAQQIFLGLSEANGSLTPQGTRANARALWNAAVVGEVVNTFDTTTKGRYGATSAAQNDLPANNIAFWNDYGYQGTSFAGSPAAPATTYSNAPTSSNSARRLYVVGNADVIAQGQIPGNANSTVRSAHTTGNFLGLFGAGAGFNVAVTPGQRAFGFDFFDLEVADIRITWSDGGTQLIDLAALGFDASIERTGFFGVTRSDATITNIRVQLLTNTEGVAFDDFTFAATLIPLPTGAAMGMACLGLLAIRRRAAR